MINYCESPGAPEAELISYAEYLIPKLRNRAPSCEKTRRLSDETISDLVQGGLIRSTVPKRLGGSEIDYHTAMLICAAISRGCGSTGLVTANMLGCTLTAALWPEKAQDEIWGKSIDTIITGTLIFPKGKAKKVEGGYILSGRWPFGSGILASSWNMFGAAVEAEHNQGGQELRMFLVPKKDWSTIDTWQTAILRGTGSHDVEVNDKFVPSYRTISVEQQLGDCAPGCKINTGPVYKLPIFSMFFSWIGSVVLGIAQGSVDDFINVTKTRVTDHGAYNLRDLTPIQIKVADARMSVDTARRIYLQNCNEAMGIVQSNRLPTIDERTRWRGEGAFAARLCVNAVDLLFTASGGGGLYDRNPISRAFRDIHGAHAQITQSFDVNATTYGRVLLGMESDNSLL